MQTEWSHEVIPLSSDLFPLEELAISLCWETSRNHEILSQGGELNQVSLVEHFPPKSHAFGK